LMALLQPVPSSSCQDLETCMMYDTRIYVCHHVLVWKRWKVAGT
jgi:hypothetical protein